MNFVPGLFLQVWKTEGVIASLAFHPTDRLLVVAAFDDLLFWDWSRPEPFAKVKTSREEKVRYVKFDTLGHTLVTGIANVLHCGQPGPGGVRTVENVNIPPSGYRCWAGTHLPWHPIGSTIWRFIPSFNCLAGLLGRTAATAAASRSMAT